MDCWVFEMATWEVHNRWAKKLIGGISETDLNLVNRLIDFPEEVDEFLEFFAETSNWFPEWKKMVPNFPLDEDYVRKIVLSEDEFDKKIKRQLLHIAHDAGRSGQPLGGQRYRGLAAFVQLKFLSSKGSDHVKAWYLHHFIDFVTSSPRTDVKEKIERIEERTGVPGFTRPEFEEVKSFFERNFDAIAHDLNQEKS